MTSLDLRQLLGAEAKLRRISCARLHGLARKWDSPAKELAALMDELGLKVSPCQLGCFGGKGRTVAPSLDEELRADLETAAEEGCLPCPRAWTIAARRRTARRVLGATVDAMELRIVACQLGFF